MKLGNYDEVGGRQIHQDDLEILQDEVLKAIQLQYAGQGAFIVQNCLVTGSAGNYTIGNGLIFINGLIMEFSSVTGITSFPKYIVQSADVLQDSFSLEQGGSGYKRTLQKAELVSSAPGSGEFIVMSASGGRNYNDILASQFMRLFGNQTIAGQKNFTSSIISNGLNINTEIGNLNTALAAKANKTITISAGDGLNGGGDLSTNRSLALSDGGVTTSKLADGSVSKIKLGSNLLTLKTPTITGTVNSSEFVITPSDLPGIKVGFWVTVSMPNNYPNIGVLSYRVKGIGNDFGNVLRQVQEHYHSGAGSSISTSTSCEFSWFCPLPPGATSGNFSIGHYVGSGVSASLAISMYI